MGGFNMPPGVSTADIPGNRGDDLAADDMADELAAIIFSVDQNPLSDEEEFRLAALVDHVMGLQRRAYGEGYDQALVDRASTNAEREDR